jgi:hypothetical protein
VKVEKTNGGSSRIKNVCVNLRNLRAESLKTTLGKIPENEHVEQTKANRVPFWPMIYRLFLTVALAAFSVLLTACATGKSGDAVKALPLSSFVPAREDAIASFGEWLEVSGGLENAIPEGARPEDVIASKDGIGVSIGLLKDFDSRDVKIECRAGITLGSVAGIVFRAEEKEGVITSMYYYALSSSGVTLWRYQGKRWTQIYKLGGIMPSQTPCLLSVRAKGDEVQLAMDETKLPPLRDTSKSAATKIGICAREGYSRFYSFEADKL